MRAEQRFKCLQQAVNVETNKEDDPDEDQIIKTADKFDEYVEDGTLPDGDESS